MIDNIEVGKTYDYFDDGKIRPSRRYKVKITEIIPFDDVTDKPTLTHWKEEVKTCHWLFAKTTDYFILGDLDLEDKIEKIEFVRTKQNTWFSLGWWGGDLDHDGKLLKIMNETEWED